ncbi:MAG: hypothetical protein IPM35_02570 [Myxococcales bacterium]|nr:hypothetical protein [Myxococcales bacterium]
MSAVIVDMREWLERKRRESAQACLVCGASLEDRRPNARYCRGDCAAEGARRNAARKRGTHG